jgi:dihydrodipicolinate synthase/N-acetylneuraminate lyase
LGQNGVISVAANAVPSDYSAMVKPLWRKLPTRTQNKLSLLDLMTSLFTEGSPAGVKLLCII